MRRGRRAGQSSLEMVLLIVAVVSAFVGLRLYLRRAVEGRMNESRWQVLGGATPYYGDSGSPLTQFYNVNSNQRVTGTTFPNTTVTDFLGRTGTRYETRFTTHVDFDECHGRTMTDNMNCTQPSWKW